MRVLPIVAAIAFFLLTPLQALAQGITISPPFQEVSFGKNVQQVVFSLAVTNNTKTPLDLSLSTQDFGALNESGGVAFLGSSGSDFERKYGLSSYLTLEKDFIEVQSGKTEKILVTIHNQASLSPGGHYAAVLVKVIPSQNTAFSDNVALTQTLSSLVFVKKTGGEIYRLSLDAVGSIQNFLGLSDIVDLRFQNSGNVHVVPRGIVNVIDPAGNIIEKGIVNEDTAFVLPETFRLIPTHLSRTGFALLPGIYTTSVVYRYEGNNTFSKKTQQFFYIPGIWYVVIMVLVVIAIVYKRKRRKV